MTKFRIINQALLNDVSMQAQASPRLRKNYNFHQHESDICSRMINAIEPTSYVMPHRHLDSTKDETMIILSGRLGVVIFDDMGSIVETFELSTNNQNKGVNLIHGCFHTVLALEPNTVIFESKAGPYAPLTPEEIASWAPRENTPEAQSYLQKLQQLFVS